MTVYDMIRLVEVMKMDIIDRLKYYEPLFNSWIVDELISSDEDISFVKVVKEGYNANETRLSKLSLYFLELLFSPKIKLCRFYRLFLLFLLFFIYFLCYNLYSDTSDIYILEVPYGLFS